MAVEPRQRRESRVVQAHRHADAEQDPRDDQPGDALRQPERREPGGERQVRDRQHRPAAMPVDQRPDIRPKRRLQQQG